MRPTRRELRLFSLLALGLAVIAATGCTRGRFIGEKWGGPADRARTTWFILRPARDFPSIREAVLAAYALEGVDRVSVDERDRIDAAVQSEPLSAHIVIVEHRRGGDGVCDIQCALQRGGYCAEEIRTADPRARLTPLSRTPMRQFEGPGKVPGRQFRAKAW